MAKNELLLETIIMVPQVTYVPFKLSIGDEVHFFYNGRGYESSIVTHIFNEGKQVIVDDFNAIPSSAITYINGIKLKEKKEM